MDLQDYVYISKNLYLEWNSVNDYLPWLIEERWWDFSDLFEVLCGENLCILNLILHAVVNGASFTGTKSCGVGDITIISGDFPTKMLPVKFWETHPHKIYISPLKNPIPLSLHVNISELNQIVVFNQINLDPFFFFKLSNHVGFMNIICGH